MSICENSIKPLSLEDVSAYLLASRPNKVMATGFARPVVEKSSLQNLLKKLPYMDVLMLSFWVGARQAYQLLRGHLDKHNSVLARIACSY